MKVGSFLITVITLKSGRISAIITENRILIDVVTGFDFGKVTAAAVRAAKFYGVEK